MKKQITYAIDHEGMTFSRVENEIATGVLDYERMTPENRYATHFNMEKFPLTAMAGRQWQSLFWTKKLPLAVKNQHRAFWEMIPLTSEAPIPRWYLNWGTACYPNDIQYTAPGELKPLLSGLGCTRIKKSPPHGNKEIGISWVFDLESVKYDELTKAIEGSKYNYLSPAMVCWGT